MTLAATFKPRRTLTFTNCNPTLTSRRSSLEETARKTAKSKNTSGQPLKLPSKLLAITPDPTDDNQVYIAEAAGTVKRVNIEVGQIPAPLVEIKNTIMRVFTDTALSDQ